MTRINGREALTMPFVSLIRWSPLLPWLVIFFLLFHGKIVNPAEKGSSFFNYCFLIVNHFFVFFFFWLGSELIIYYTTDTPSLVKFQKGLNFNTWSDLYDPTLMFLYMGVIVLQPLWTLSRFSSCRMWMVVFCCLRCELCGNLVKYGLVAVCAQARFLQRKP